MSWFDIYDGFMLFSNILFLIPAYISYKKKLKLLSILTLCVCFSSTIYHLYLKYQENEINRIKTFILLCVDVFFANINGIAFLTLLLPHIKHYSEVFNKNAIIILSGVITIYAGFLSGSIIWQDVENDGSMYTMIANAIYIFIIYILFVFSFIPHKEDNILISKWEGIKNYYKRKFNTSLLILSLGFMVFGVIAWTVLQRLNLIDYRILHPFWHIFVIISQILLLISLK
jgi:hypothetical protein